MHNCNCRTKQAATPVPLPYINRCASTQELAMAYVPWQTVSGNYMNLNKHCGMALCSKNCTSRSTAEWEADYEHSYDP